MPTWGEILSELQQEQTRTGQAPFDSVRRKYIAKLQAYTKRNTVLYASAWTQQKPVQPETISLNDEDISGFMEVVYQLKGNDLDIIIHSPGGSAEATESIVGYLRSKFDDIRVFVPHAAMSAATMLACAANCIVMAKHSSLGPIDPQFILQTQLGVQVIPAQAILEQFERAQLECRDPQLATSWFPILGQYGPALIIQCTNALNLARELVEKWLHDYMFNGKTPNPAHDIAEELSNHGNFKSHGRHIPILKAQKMGLNIQPLEDDHQLQEHVLSVFHATMHTFSATPASKIIENHLGRAFVKLQPQMVVQQPMISLVQPPRPT